jgi:hypothetical protein
MKYSKNKKLSGNGHHSVPTFPGSQMFGHAAPAVDPRPSMQQWDFTHTCAHLIA